MDSKIGPSYVINFPKMLKKAGKTQRAHDIQKTLLRRHFSVATSFQRPYDIVLTLCAGWEWISPIYRMNYQYALGWLLFCTKTTWQQHHMTSNLLVTRLFLLCLERIKNMSYLYFNLILLTQNKKPCGLKISADMWNQIGWLKLLAIHDSLN